MASWLSFIARSKSFSVRCTVCCSRKTSVEPHHTITVRLAPDFFLKVRMSSRICSARSSLFLPFLTCVPARFLTYSRSKRRLHRANALQKLFHLSQMLVLQHAAFLRRLVRVIGEDIPAAENQIAGLGQRHEFVDLRRAILGALAQTNGAHLRERADRRRFTAANQLHSGHERGADRTHSRREHAQLAFWRRDADGPAHSFPPVCV